MNECDWFLILTSGQAGSECDLRALLSKHKPPISVDASGGSSFLIRQMEVQRLTPLSGEYSF